MSPTGSQELDEILRMFTELQTRAKTETLRQLAVVGEQATRDAIPAVRDLRTALTELLARCAQAKENVDRRRADIERTSQELMARADRSEQDLKLDIEKLRRIAPSKRHLEQIRKMHKQQRESIEHLRSSVKTGTKFAMRTLDLQLKTIEVQSTLANQMFKALDDLAKGIRPSRVVIREGILAAVGIVVGAYDVWLGIAFEVAELLNNMLQDERKQAEKYVAELEAKVRQLRIHTLILPQVTSFVNTIEC